MELMDCIPWIRFADDLNFTIVRGPSKTYDCRLLYAQKGEAKLEMDGTVYSLRRGALVLFQPGTQYSIRPRESITLTVLDFDFTQDYSDREAFLSPCPAAAFDEAQAHKRVEFQDAPELNKPLYLEDADFAQPLLQSIIAEFHTRQTFFRGSACAVFKTLLYQLVRASRTGTEPQDLMGRMRKYIDKHKDRRITNEELGAALNYNPNYLNRLVQSNTGMSLHRYVLQYRLTQAANQLSSTDRPIQLIAASLGFHSPAHFTHFFKDAMGVSPVEFRKNHIL